MNALFPQLDAAAKVRTVSLAGKTGSCSVAVMNGATTNRDAPRASAKASRKRSRIARTPRCFMASSVRAVVYGGRVPCRSQRFLIQEKNKYVVRHPRIFANQS